MKPIRLLAALAALLFAALVAGAVETKNHTDSTAANFRAGRLENVFIDGRGRVVLAPEESELLTDVDHAWCIAAGPGGALYAGTVPDGKVYQVQGGKSEVLFDTKEAGVFALAVAPGGDIFAGTGSDGKVFRITPDGAGELAADLDETYVFALAFEKSGALLAATGGGKGRIYRLGGEKPALVYDSPSAHLLALSTDGDAVYAASGDRGAVYQVSADGSARVLFSAPQGVVQALCVAGDGTVVAGTAAIAEGPPAAKEEAVRSIIGELQRRQGEPPASPTPPAPPAKREYKVTNAVYAIRPGGDVREIFEIKGGLVLSLLARDGDVLAATAGKPGIYRVPLSGEPEAELWESESEDVHALYGLPDGSFAAGLGMPGKIVRFGPGLSRTGTFTSRVMKADNLTRWGAISWDATTPTGTKATLSVRSGNSEKPDATWSDWRGVEGAAAAETALPPSRYVQYRAEMATASPEVTPELEKVTIAGLEINLAPEIAGITAGKKEAKAQQPPPKRNGPGNPDSGDGGELSGTVTVSWKARDPNGDKLKFALAFRDEAISKWLDLDDDLDKPTFDWDTMRVPDGCYYFRVRASDSPSNPPGTELVFSKEEGPFTVDNTGPALSVGVVKTDKGHSVVEVTAADAATPLEEAFYSIDGGEWESVFPADGIFDSPTERITVTVEKEDAVILMLRVSDRAGNTSAVRVLLEAR